MRVRMRAGSGDVGYVVVLQVRCEDVVVVSVSEVVSVVTIKCRW